MIILAEKDPRLSKKTKICGEKQNVFSKQQKYLSDLDQLT